jgi:YHS domain-containing protein
MAKRLRLIASQLLCGVIASCLQQGGASGDNYWPRPACPAAPCIPNALNFGYYQTRWREWPGEAPPERKFPRSVGAEVVPTPAGTETVPLPKASAVPSKPPTAKEEGLPETILPFGPESKEPVLPPGKQLRSKASTIEEQPAAPAAPSTKAPSLDQALPPIQLPEKAEPAAPSAAPNRLPQGPADKEELIPAEPKKTGAPKTIDSGSYRRRPGGALSSELNGGAGTAPLQADWSRALNPESLSDGRLVLASCQSDADNAPRLALGGYCPVRLLRREAWVRGSSRYQATHGGQLFLFSGPAERQEFLSAPNRYLPACGGNDPVMLSQEGRQVPGKPQHAAVSNGRLYLFASAGTLERFREEPNRYLNAAGTTPSAAPQQSEEAAPMAPAAAVGYSAPSSYPNTPDSTAVNY